MYLDSWTGKKYSSFDEYCNSDGIDPDLIFSYLVRGLRTPQNEEEVKIRDEGRKILETGGFDISF